MNIKYTSITLLKDPGIADYGKRTRDEMIKQYREYAGLMKARADMILTAADTDFIVEQSAGIHKRTDVVMI